MSQDESREAGAATDEAPPDDSGEAPPAVPGDGPSWPLSPPARRKKWPWILGTLGFVLIVASVVASFIRLPYYTIAPGDALNVDTLVTVHGARQYPPTGAVMLLFVQEQSQINGWRWLQASLDSEIDLVKQQDIGGNADPAQVDAQAVYDMANSQNYARYVALRRLGYKVGVEPRVEVLAVIGDRPAHGVLKQGDVIVAIDGHAVTRPEQLVTLVSARHPGDVISVAYQRGGQRHVASIRTANDGKGHAVIGVFIAWLLKFPIDVRIDTRYIGGPSAGLAMTLAVLDELTPGNLTGGKRVAVTGDIVPDGSVLEVGGVAQKAVAARHRGAQLFIVPIQEVAEARTRVGSMPVVGVRNLDDALKALRAAGGDPLPAVRGQIAA